MAIGRINGKRAHAILDRKVFMKLPVEERRRILEEQAKALQKHYEKLADQEKPGGDDFIDY